MFGFYYPFIPRIPNTNDKPPTIYSLLNSYVNGEEDNFLEESYVTPSKLAKEGRNIIFDFDYPLSNKVDKEEFETLILNKFMMRRIGYETLTAFKIALNVKLHEIMPKYNKLFDVYNEWNLFNDGESTTRIYNETRNDSSESTNNITNNNTMVSDRRFSNVPQNQIQDIKSGDYMTDYNYDTDTNNSINNSEGSSNNNGNTNITETIKRSPSDKIKLFKDMIEIEKNIYSMIFKDLNSLFYGLV